MVSPVSGFAASAVLGGPDTLPRTNPTVLVAQFRQGTAGQIQGTSADRIFAAAQNVQGGLNEVGRALDVIG